MNKIKIEGHQCDVGENIDVIHNGIKLHSANDVEYESSDAASCVSLLVSMAKNGVIELEVSGYVANNWKESRQYVVWES